MICGFYVTTLHQLFYKKIVVEGKDNIPKDGPLIFAPNHQNALMDPLAVLFTCFRQIVFLARADVFKNKILAKLFYFLKILPIFRIRDGKDNLQNNDETFNVAIRVLESKQNIGIFPEAQHNNKRSLLPSKKGIPRLAFMAEEKNNFDLDIKIIPVGIYYSRYNKMMSTLHVRYGEPIAVKNYQAEYIENPQKAMNSLRDKIEESLRPLMIDIRNMELYDTYESIRTLYTKNLIRKFQLGKLSQRNKFKADKITIKALETYEKDNPDKMIEIKAKVEEYEKLKKEYNLSNQSIEKPRISIFRAIFNSFLILLTLPVFLYGFLSNIITYFVPQFIVSKIKDKQFHSSVKFVWAAFGIPIVYLIQIIIFAIIFPKFWWVLAYAISLPVSGLLARMITEWGNVLKEDWLLIKLRKLKPEMYNKIKTLHKEIIYELDLIVTHWNRKEN
jgi:1-acyl-sn-glycerol-3-phosphate acyltransferase